MPAHPGNTRQRLTAAISKLLFCCKVCRTPRSWLRLIIHTKAHSWSAAGKSRRPGEDPVHYALRLDGQPATIALRTQQGDLQIFYDIWWKRSYQLPSGIFLQATTIVDLGAHVGMTSLFFNIHAPQATIYAVEADPGNYQLFCRNLSSAIQNGRVIPVQAAIHARQQPVYLQKETYSYNTHVADRPTEYMVAGMRLSDLIGTHHLDRIDILKIDIEGAERCLLQEADTWLPITRNILIELHDDQLLAQFLHTLKAYGFSVTKRTMDYEDIYWAAR